MNFLAHLYLSGEQPSILVGNFIGDFVKGRNGAAQFAPAIVRGIELHRSIDEFTDHHPVVARSKNRLRPVYRHYAAVIVDVFYDHYLARDWGRYHAEPLATFASRAYHVLLQHDAVLPERVRQMLPYMIKGNWLVNYAQVEGIQRALTGMARRTPYVSRMEEAVNDLRRHDEAFGNEFHEFFPELVQHTKNFLTNP